MAQRGSGKRRQAPAYSADAMAVRYMAGLVLIALGVLIFMAVELRLQGSVFQGLRQLCFGLCGIMAYALPALPVWAGVLVIWSTQRRAPVRPWLFALLAFFCLCAFIMIISGALDWLKRQNTVKWGAVTNAVYADSAARMERAGGGGAAGAILAWPLWNYLGQVLGTIITFVLTAFCILLALNLTPSRLRDLFTGQAGVRREQQRREREYMEQQQVAWQQQQQQAWQQQQQILEQQQQYQYPPQPVQPQYAPEQAMPQQPVQPWPTQNDGGVRDWQEQAAAGQLDTTGHQSRIFGRQPEKKTTPQGNSFVSRIFSKKKEEEYDGLSDGSTLDQTARPVRRTATGKEIVQPQTRWKPETKTEETPALQDVNRRNRTPSVQQTTIDIPDNKPAAQPEPEPAREPEPERKPEPARDNSQYRRPVAEDKKPADRKPVRPAVPAVQQEIKPEVWKPAVKLPEKKKTEEDEGPWMPTPYNYPPITDLARPQPGVGDTQAEDAMRSRKLEETLASFRVQARVVHVTHGPAISRFELELEAGTKVSKVSELEKDIAYGMSATSVRIEAPIPGQRLVGVEVPNRKVTTVTLREVM